ncbi:hypothetical protein, partial [Escherichia coli]|uniref:hypothetical protein n=1 Tax=Escherichia coli TaxID=562 RepID=UPI003CE57A18
MLLGSIVGAAAAGAALGGGLTRPAVGTVPAATGLIDPALAGVHPRLILGTRVSLTELQRRAAAPAYAPF